MSRVFKRLIVMGKPWTVEKALIPGRGVRYTVGYELYTADDCRRSAYSSLWAARSALVEAQAMYGEDIPNPVQGDDQ